MVGNEGVLGTTFIIMGGVIIPRRIALIPGP